MTANCLWCEQYVEFSNLRWPGFCSPQCRDADREHREAKHQESRRRRRRAAEDRG